MTKYALVFFLFGQYQQFHCVLLLFFVFCGNIDIHLCMRQGAMGKNAVTRVGKTSYTPDTHSDRPTIKCIFLVSGHHLPTRH